VYRFAAAVGAGQLLDRALPRLSAARLLCCAGLPEDAAAAAGVTAQRLLSMQQLEVQMDRARRAGKPLMISRLPVQSGSSEQSSGTYIQAS
jgi:hypothetical protein